MGRVKDGEANDDVAHRYKDEPAQEYWRHQESIGRLGGKLNLFKFVDHVSPSDLLVDFGCGGGYLLENLHCKEKIGVEVNPHAVQVGQSKGLDIRPSLDEVTSDWATVVISNHALEHVIHPFLVLKGMLRVLVPGGKVVLVLPMDDWRNQRVADPRDPNGHLYTWTPQSIYNLLKEAGFVDVEATILAHAWPPYVTRIADSPRLFKFLGRIHSIRKRMRQLVVIGQTPSESESDERTLNS